MKLTVPSGLSACPKATEHNSAAQLLPPLTPLRPLKVPPHIGLGTQSLAPQRWEGAFKEGRSFAIVDG